MQLIKSTHRVQFYDVITVCVLQDEKAVRLFYANGWADKPLEQRAVQTFLDLRDEVTRWQAKTQDDQLSTLVVCR